MYTENYCIVGIKDTGIGIDKDEEDSVFDAFYQVNNAARNQSKGVGLGLSIVKRSCQLLGHQLKMHSQLGKGTNFEIYLPLATELSPPDPATSLQHYVSAPVLVVDNDLSILDGMEAMLNAWGHKVFTAQSLAEAVEHMKINQDIALMLVDYNLQDQYTGTFVIQEIRKIETVHRFVYLPFS